MSPPEIDVRLAGYGDIQAIVAFDAEAKTDRSALNFVNQTIASRNCYVAMAAGQVLGYVVLEYSFFGHGIITRILVDPEHRRRGAGTALVRQVENVCATPKLFATAPTSNPELRSLLGKLEFQPSGTIENLEDDEAMCVYFTLSSKGRWGRRR